MRLALLASGAFAEPTLNWLSQSEHEIALVITQPARKAGRGMQKTPTPIAQLTADLGYETIEMEDVNTPSMIEQLRSLDVTLGLVIAFGQKLGPKLLGLWPGGCINLHASLLPKYRGAAPINWAIVHGEERTGCTMFRIESRMDTGPILSSRWTQIKPEETAGELHDRLAVIGVDAVNAALQLYQDGAIPEGTPQNDQLASQAPKMKKKDGLIDFNRSTIEVTNHICGMTPWPGAIARFESRDKRWEDIIIIRARPAEDYSQNEVSLEPGLIDSRRYVATSDGFIEILELKPSSGRMMSWSDYVNGRHVSEGDKILSLL